MKKHKKKRHDWYRRQSWNLVDIYEGFTEEEKTLMLKSWNSRFPNNQISLALVPFVIRNKMIYCIRFELVYQELVHEDVLFDKYLNIMKKLNG